LRSAAPDIAFQLHLISQLDKHQGNDLNMFHEIIACMKSHAYHHNVDFSTLQILSHKQLVQLLTKYYQMDFLKPRLHSVPLSGGTVATMTVFDVKALLIAFLNNLLKIREENFASNYDGPEGRSLYCLNLNCRAPPGRFFRSDLTGWWQDV